MLFGQFTKLYKNCFMFQFMEEEYTLRTKDGHAHQVRQVALDPNLASAYGVKTDSLLNTSKYYRVQGPRRGRGW